MMPKVRWWKELRSNRLYKLFNILLTEIEDSCNMNVSKKTFKKYVFNHIFNRISLWLCYIFLQCLYMTFGNCLDNTCFYVPYLCKYHMYLASYSNSVWFNLLMLWIIDVFCYIHYYISIWVVSPFFAITVYPEMNILSLFLSFHFFSS